MKILKFIGNLVEVIVTFINKVVWYFCYYVYLGIYTVFRIDSKNLKVKLQKRLLKPYYDCYSLCCNFCYGVKNAFTYGYVNRKRFY